MMKWNVQYTKKSEEDLKSIYEYIANTLQEPAIAEKQIIRIMDAIEQLDEFPLQYHMYEKEPWKSKGLRVLPVNKYLAFYIPDETKNTVTIVRIMYGGRDIDTEMNK
jgi:toxin ParE1/3/4